MPVSRLFSILFAVVFVQGSYAQCSFDHDGFSASWALDDNDKVQFQVTKKNMDDNTWVAVGFGPAMFEGLDIAMIKVIEGDVSVTDEKVFGYDAPIKDNSQDIHVESKEYSNKNLKVKFNRPLVAGNNQEDRNLKGCIKWQFAAAGGPVYDKEGHVGYHVQTPITKEICIEKCRT